jgi:hypothetical protein
MGRQSLLQGLASAMEPNHGVVGREFEFGGKLRHWYAVKDHPSKDGRVLWLELLGLHENAPTIDSLAIDGSELKLVHRQDGDGALAEFVEQDIADHTSDPSLGAGGIAQLFRTFKNALQCQLEDLFGVDLCATPSTNHGQQLVTPRHQGVAHSSGGRRVLDLHVHAGIDSALRGRNVQP